MRKKTFRLLSLMLCLAILCYIPAYAMEVRGSDELKYSSAVLSKSSTGELNIIFTATATGRADVIGAESVEIQRLVGGSYWVTEHTYTVDDIPELESSGIASYAYTFTHTPRYPTLTYRAIVTIHVEVNGGTTTRRLLTNEV